MFPPWGKFNNPTKHSEKMKRNSHVLFSWKILWNASRELTISFLIISVLAGLMTGVEALSISSLVNKITGNLKTTSLSLGIFSSIILWVTLLISSIIVKQLINSLQSLISAHLNELVGESLKSKIYAKSLSLDLISFESSGYYDDLERAKKATNTLASALETSGNLIIILFELAIIIFAVINVGFFYALLLFVGFVPLVYAVKKGNEQFMEVNYRQSPLQRKLSYWRDVLTKRDFATELRIFELSGFFLGRWQKLFRQMINELFIARKKMSTGLLKSYLVIHLLTGIVIIGCVLAGIKGSISIGSLIATLYLLNRFDNVIGMAGFYTNELARFYLDFQYISKFLALVKEENRCSEQKSLCIKQQGITFENVSFTYPEKKEPSLIDLNFHISWNERLAIVGENGAGKSTLALILLGLYQPTKGRVLIDGVDLKEMDTSKFQARVAAVFQNFLRFELSARENIVFGNISFMQDEERILQAATKCDIHTTLQSLPFGYNTLLGRGFEGAQDLSGGQWQKLAICRAYFKDADILILDEPAASLDAKSEYEIYNHFYEVSKHKTVLLISHRLGSARLADRIIYLHKGQIMEIGSHDELIRKGALYAALYSLQAEWYRPDESGRVSWNES